MAVVVSTVAVAVFDAPVADPVAAILIGGLVLWSAGRVLGESVGILLERSPVSVTAVSSDLLAIDGVATVEDTHVWQVCSRLTVATVRLTTPAARVEDYERIRTAAHETMARHGVDHATVELRTGAETERTDERS